VDPLQAQRVPDSFPNREPPRQEAIGM